MRVIKVAAFFVLVLVTLIWIINSYIEVKARPYIYKDHLNIPSVETVLIPGASVYRSGALSPVLMQRVEVGIQYVFKNDSVKLLFSGHTIENGYNEPAAMAEFAKKRLVPPHKIIQDSSGVSTYATIFNGKIKYKLKSVLIITQEYHLPRAIYIAQNLGLEAYGLVAPSNNISTSKKVPTREILSRFKDFALIQIYKLFDN